jgi:hypothetical protein
MNDTTDPLAFRKARAFDTLQKIIDREDTKGEFSVTLRYDNYQDGAIIKNGDEVIAECYDWDPDSHPEDWPLEQFLRALELAEKTLGTSPAPEVPAPLAANTEQESTTPESPWDYIDRTREQAEKESRPLTTEETQNVDAAYDHIIGEALTTPSGMGAALAGQP